MSLSRIRASVTTVVPVISVQVGVPGATGQVRATSFKATVTALVPLASVRWINIAYDVLVDTRGLNPRVKDITATVDASALHFFKSAYDSTAVVDEQTYVLLRKTPIEPLLTAETRSVDLHRAIDDAVDATDDLYGQANLDDEQVMFFAKSLQPDYMVAADNVNSILVGKRALDAAATADQIKSRAVGKQLADAPKLTEQLSRSLDKALADQADAGDELNVSFVSDDGQVMFLLKNIPIEYLTTGDAIGSFQVGKRSLDSAATADSLLRFVGKAAFDVAAATETRTAVFSKPTSDAFLVADAAQVETRKPLSNSFLAADFPSLGPEKVADSGATAGDELLPFEFGKGISDTPATAEQQLFDISKTAQTDIAPTSELLTYHGGKPLLTRTYFPNEGPNQYDTYATAYFAADYCREGFPAISFFKSGADVAISSDAIGGRVFTKPLADVVDATDDFLGATITDDDQIMVFSKQSTDNTSTSETTRRASTKPLFDTFTVPDTATRTTGKALADSFAKSDSTANSVGKRLLDSALTGETRTVSTSKSAADSFGAADVRAAAVSKTTNDSFTKSDATVKTAGKGLADSVSKSDSGSLVFTDYWDINYTVTSLGPYVGNSRTF